MTFSDRDDMDFRAPLSVFTRGQTYRRLPSSAKFVIICHGISFLHGYHPMDSDALKTFLTVHRD